MRRLIVGDIHGCFEEFRELLDRAGLCEDDEIIALGDIVDRGPQSPEVLEFFRSFRGARTLMGNHERKHVRSFMGQIHPALSQKITRRQIREAAYPGACSWMATLPPFLQFPEALLVHGMFEPGVPITEQREAVIVGTLTGEAHLRKRYEKPWHELYDGSQPIIVGHHNILGTSSPYVRADGRVWGLDTDVYAGRVLSGLLLPEFRLLSVPAREDHWSALKMQHSDLRISPTRWEAFTFEQAEAVLGREDGSFPGIPPGAQDLRTAIRRADLLLPRLYDLLRQTHDRILAALREQCPFDSLDPAEQARAYDKLIPNRNLARLLHWTRRRGLTRELLRGKLKRPAEVIRLGVALGIDEE